MADLITLNQARLHLKLDVSDADLSLKLEQAEAIVLNYIERSDDDGWTAEIAAWTDETVPRPVQAAILLQLGELFRFRGDDAAQDVPKREHGFLAPGIVALLHRYRDPVVA